MKKRKSTGRVLADEMGASRSDAVKVAVRL